MSNVANGMFSIASRFSAYEAHEFLKTGIIDFGVDEIGERKIKHYTPDEVELFLSRIRSPYTTNSHIRSTLWTESPCFDPLVTEIRTFQYDYSRVPDSKILPISFLAPRMHYDEYRKIDAHTVAACWHISCAGWPQSNSGRFVSTKTAFKWKKQCESYFGVPFDLVKHVEIRYGNDLKEITPTDPTSIDYQTMIMQNLHITKEIR